MFNKRTQSFLIYLAIAAVLAVLAWFTIGMGWALVALFGFWISANCVLWFKRHPPPPEAFRGGKK